MKKLAKKRWIRVAAAILFLVCLAASVLGQALVRYGRYSGWYRMGKERGFENSNPCQSYVMDGVSYIIRYVKWSGDLTNDQLGSYSGSAFSYVIYDDTGSVMADTRTDSSRYVFSEYSYYDYYEVYDAEMDGTAVFYDAEAYDAYMAEAKAEEPATADRSVGNTDNVVSAYTERAFHVAGYVNLPVDPYGGCYAEYMMYEMFFPLRYSILLVVVLAVLLMTFSALVLCLGAALRGREGRLKAFMKWPFDLVLLGAAACLIFIYFFSVDIASRLIDLAYIFLASSTMYLFYDSASQGIRFAGFAILLAAVLWYMSGQLGARILRDKLRLKRLMRPGALRWLGVGLAAVHIVLLVIMLARPQNAEGIGLLLIAFDIVSVILLLIFSAGAKRVQRAAEELSNGNLSYKTDAKKLHFIWRPLGESLNRIGDGMAQAVEDRIRSERMKTELITNVSHDLKTPLTSVINYIDFLKRDDLDEPTRQEYLAILERQSAKLKKLTEDVVEASKAASGSLPVRMEPINAIELLEQFVGEFDDRMYQAGITPVLSVPDHPVLVQADSTHLGRVIENLITNVVKYAMPGTRVYFDLLPGAEETAIEVKNVSRAPLNISPEELLERFVRGDSSRHSEGSGLGLSIAQSLAELMDGRLELFLDGDLFKARVVLHNSL